MKYSIPKGTFDILPHEPKEEDWWRLSHHWEYLESVIRTVAHDFGFSEIRTPIFERSELFVRAVGEASDIVSKEMYTFEDRGGRSLTLRPEGTACVMRAFVEKNLHQLGGPHKYFYISPMFRYERPQAGRYRQHHQFGCEAIGIKSPEQDVEMIEMVCELFRRLGLKDLTVMVNSVGSADSRDTYREALRTFLEPQLASLSKDSQHRFEKNVLRILDSKDEGDQKILENAPLITDFLDEESKEHFDTVCTLLEKIGLNFIINPKLVRGLDYYNKTVFEITSSSLGAHNALGGGGRYDGMTKLFGGPDLPAVGFGSGLERILQTMMKHDIAFPLPKAPFVYLVPMGDAAHTFCFETLCQLRRNHIPAEMDFSGKKVKYGLQQADSLNAHYCVVIGDDELNTSIVKLKALATRTEEETSLSTLIETLKRSWNAHTLAAR